jgi:hypothetical protein
MKRKYVIAGLSLIAVLAIAPQVLAGQSLQSLVKKEVAKQLATSPALTAKKKGKRGPQGPPGPQGAAGTNGANGTARAYGYVDKFFCANPGACTNISPNKGVASVNHLGGGKYCVSVPGLSPATAPAVASVALDESFPGNGSNQVGFSELGSLGCPYPNYQFQTFDPADPNANVDTSFTFVIP